MTHQTPTTYKWSPLQRREVPSVIEKKLNSELKSTRREECTLTGKENIISCCFDISLIKPPYPYLCLMYVIDSTCLAPFLPADVRLELAWAERCIVSLKISHLSYSRALLIPLSRQQINQTGSNGWREGLCRLTRP